MRIARVITTWNCPRDCDLCCNKDPGTAAQVKDCRIADLANYDQVLLTGGEPTLYPAQLFEIVRELRSQTPAEKQKIYLYTAQFIPALQDLVPVIDGVHFTLHHPARLTDLHGFQRFQRLIRGYVGSDKSFRLYLEPRIAIPIEIIPSYWTRVEVSPWRADCPLPPNEELFQLAPRGGEKRSSR